MNKSAKNLWKMKWTWLFVKRRSSRHISKLCNFQLDLDRSVNYYSNRNEVAAKSIWPETSSWKSLFNRITKELCHLIRCQVFFFLIHLFLQWYFTRSRCAVRKYKRFFFRVWCCCFQHFVLLCHYFLLARGHYMHERTGPFFLCSSLQNRERKKRPTDKS